MKTGIYKQRAKDVMSRDVVSIHSHTTVHEALKLMVENRVSALPVVDRNNRCTGVVSSSDLVELTKDLEDELESLEEDPAIELSLVKRLVSNTTHETVDDLMSGDVASVRPEALLSKVATTMLRNRVHRLPVLDTDDHVVGIISTMDILGAFADSAFE